MIPYDKKWSQLTEGENWVKVDERWQQRDQEDKDIDGAKRGPNDEDGD